MTKFLGKLFTNILIILVPTFFCSLMSTPFSFAVPLHCPAGSRVIGIECFDESYKNTTPWYRKDFGPSELTFPFWLAGFTVITVIMAVKKPSLGNTQDQSDYTSDQQSEQPVRKFAVPTQSSSRDWLPANCPHCGGSISTQNVDWISNDEARCPYCASTLKQ